MGSTPHAHARAKAESPHHQGLCAMISVFIVLCYFKSDRICSPDNGCDELRQGWYSADTGGIHAEFWKLWFYFYCDLPAVLRIFDDSGMASLA